MNVGVIGAGAVGSYVVWGLDKIEGYDTYLIAEGERKERLSKGIMVNGEKFTPMVVSPDTNINFNVIFLCTKYSGLDKEIVIINKCASEKTLLLSLMNGIDSEERMKKNCKNGIVVPAMIKIASRRDDDGTWFKPEMTQGIFWGLDKKENNNEEYIINTLNTLFRASRMVSTFKENIERDIWIKFASNIANNLPQAVLGTDATLYVNSEHGYYIADRLWKEVYEIAKAKGIELPEETGIFTGIPLTSKYSTLQDIENGRKTEIDMFAGYSIEVAKEYGINVPFLEYTYHAIKALEEKNEGKIGK